LLPFGCAQGRLASLLEMTKKSTCIRVRTALSLQDARAIVADFVDHYNTRRLHSAIGYITAKDKLEGRAETIFCRTGCQAAWAVSKEKGPCAHNMPGLAPGAGFDAVNPGLRFDLYLSRPFVPLSSKKRIA